MTSLPIPASPEQVTDEWLTSALRGDGALRRASVTAHTMELPEPQGAAAVVARFGLDYDVVEEDAPRSLVAKFASPHGPIRALMHGFGGYLREVEFYRQFGADPGIPTPRCFHADIDPASGVFVLVLEDMSRSRIMDGISASVEDAEAAVRHLAPFHARWWNHPRLRELEFLRYPGSPADAAFMALGRGALGAALPAVKEQLGSALPATIVTVAERVLANFDALMENRRRLVQDGVTLVHGDYHPGQMFFESHQGGRFAVFDWQTVNAGNGGDDLARIIATGLTAEQQDAVGQRLIELYRSLLVEHGVAGFTAEQCRERFKLGLVTSAVINVIAWPSIDPALIAEAEAVSGRNLLDAMFGWLAAALEAYDAVGAL